MTHNIYNGRRSERVGDKLESSLRNMIPLTFGEEVGNAVTHGAAAIIFIFLLPFTSVYMYQADGALHAVGGSIFVISIIFMLLSSAIYHVMAPNSTHKYVMRLLDHSFIFIAIAGTYTPIALSLIGGWFGWMVFAIQWVTAILGILYKVLSKKQSGKVSMLVYMIMGWMAVVIMPFIYDSLTFGFVLFIILGGIMYTIGAWFYAQKGRKYFHMIWHFFIILASASHYVGIVFFMI